MLLKQGIIYKYVGKGKWIDLWYICSYKEDGAYLTLYRDSSTKKPFENSINLKLVSERIRFGATCNQFISYPEIERDPHIHSSAFIAILIEKIQKKKETLETLWLCAESVPEMFDLIKIISKCHTVQKLSVPPINDKNDTNALHNYLPISFNPESAWESYYDNPAKNLGILSDTMAIVRSSSVDDISRKRTLKDLKKKRQEKHPKAARSMTVLNDTDMSRSVSIAESINSYKNGHQRTPSPTLCKNFEQQQISMIVEKSDAALLSRSSELAERPVIAPKPVIIARTRHRSISSQDQGDAISNVSQSPVPSERRSLKNCVHVLPPLPKKNRYSHTAAQTDVSLMSTSRTVIIETYNEPMNYKHTQWQTISLKELPINCENTQNISLDDENLHIKIEEFKNSNTDNEEREMIRRVSTSKAKPIIRNIEVSAMDENDGIMISKTIDKNQIQQQSQNEFLVQENFDILSRDSEAQLSELVSKSAINDSELINQYDVSPANVMTKSRCYKVSNQNMENTLCIGLHRNGHQCECDEKIESAKIDFRERLI